jgi:voltage-gated potassium channel Kch
MPMANHHSPDPARPSRSHRVLQTVRSHVRPGSFPLLLGAFVFIYGLNGLAIESPAGVALVQIGRAGVLCAGIYVLSTSRLTLSLGLLMLGLIIVFATYSWSLDPRTSRGLQDSTTVAFLLWVLVVVLRETFRPSTSERDAVVGALCGFLLLLTIFMRVHGLVEALSPGAYRPDGPPLSERSDAVLIATFQYFSTVTLTTVGFGDIVPVAPGARLVTGLEAIVGQLYLAVVVATLVGRVAARRE